LHRMAAWTARRNAHAASLRAALSPFTGPDKPLRQPELTGDGNLHAQYKFYAYVQPEHLAPGWTRDRIVEAITAQGVPCFQGSCSEVYREKAFDGTGWRPDAPLPVAQDLGATSVMFLVHPTLTDAEIAQTCATAAQVLAQATAPSFPPSSPA